MRTVLAAGLAVVLMVAAVSASADSGQRKGGPKQDAAQSLPPIELQKKDRLHDTDRIRQQDQARVRDEEIYGHELMSQDELAGVYITKTR